MKRLLLVCLGTLVLAAGCLFAPGCSTGRQIAYGAKVFTSRTNPDYNRLEAARKTVGPSTAADASVKKAVSSPTQPTPPPVVGPEASFAATPIAALPNTTDPLPPPETSSLVDEPLSPVSGQTEIPPETEPVQPSSRPSVEIERPRTEPTTSRLQPQTSNPKLPTSNLPPLTSNLQPQTANLETPTTALKTADVPAAEASTTSLPAPTSPTVASDPSVEPAPAALPAPVNVPSSRWTQYRGPKTSGSVQDPSLTIPFPADGPTLRWKQPIGGGYGSFVFAGTAGDFVVTHEQRRDEEAIVAYNLADGTERWTYSYPAKFTETMSGEGPRSTPCIHQGRVHALGATGELNALDLATGALLWRKNVLNETAAENITYGLSASPVIIDGKLIVVGGSVLALDPATGDEIWRAASEKAAYVTPMPFDGAIVAITASRLVALDPASGTRRWSHPWKVMMGLSCANPVDIGGGQLFVSGGYGKGAALLDVAGDQVTERWSNKRMKNKFNTSVHHNGYLYGLDEGILTCVEAATGKRMWKGGRYSYGQTLLANDHLVVSTSDGELAIVKASPDSFQEVSKTPAIEGMTWNTPAIDNGVLLVRNAYEMACFEVR